MLFIEKNNNSIWKFKKKTDIPVIELPPPPKKHAFLGKSVCLDLEISK